MSKYSKVSKLANQIALVKTPRAHEWPVCGETLAETLIGLLIAALSLVMLTTAIASASRIVIKARHMSGVYESATQTLAPAAGTQETDDVVITSDGTFGESYGEDGLSVSVAYVEHELPGSITGITYE